MQEGDVVIVAMPQANGVVKDRPAIILREMPPFRDMLVCGVSTQLRHAVKDFDEVISPADADFVGSGLNAESLIRLGFLVVIPRQEIVGSIGSISSERHNRLLQRLSDYLIHG
ncbi:MAG: type II toxin-antitoxin system PemK/MazF family toxin [Acidobacteriota bacterium]